MAPLIATVRGAASRHRKRETGDQQPWCEAHCQTPLSRPGVRLSTYYHLRAMKWGAYCRKVPWLAGVNFSVAELKGTVAQKMTAFRLPQLIVSSPQSSPGLPTAAALETPSMMATEAPK